jgi:hypothetical protein
MKNTLTAARIRSDKQYDKVGVQNEHTRSTPGRGLPDGKLDFELIQIDTPEDLFLYLLFPYLKMGLDKLILLILKV